VPISSFYDFIKLKSVFLFLIFLFSFFIFGCNSCSKDPGSLKSDSKTATSGSQLKKESLNPFLSAGIDSHIFILLDKTININNNCSRYKFRILLRDKIDKPIYAKKSEIIGYFDYDPYELTPVPHSADAKTEKRNKKAIKEKGDSELRFDNWQFTSPETYSMGVHTFGVVVKVGDKEYKKLLSFSDSY
jgi:hypothetical protein